MADCIAVNCCDDRIRKLVLDYLEDQLGMSTVNVETDQNPSLMLAGNPASAQTSSFIKRVHLLAQSFGVEMVVVIAHHELY